MGVNLDNVFPTKSINELIAQRNKLNSDKPELKPISREKFLARTFNNLESFIKRSESPEGLKELLDLYHKYW